MMNCLTGNQMTRWARATVETHQVEAKEGGEEGTRAEAKTQK